jgi:RHS repeat-associated protein
VTARHDYHPFGEEIATSQRTAGLGYADDTVRKQFTGYERDNESGLDFAQARMYNNQLGRFAAVDPYNIILEAKAEPDAERAKAKLVSYLTKVQQWNRYAYVTNNPLVFRDPSGEILELTGTRAERDEAFNRILELCGEGCGLHLREKDGRTFVEYFDHGGGPSERVALIGQVLEDIIDSSTVVELQVTNKSTVTWADGDSENLSNRGALTRPISTEKIQIFISTSMSMEKLADTAHFAGVRGEDGSKISFTKSVQLAHELGHAWGAIKDRYVQRYNQAWFGSSVINENKNRSVQVENWQRNRLGLTRRANH